MTEPEPVPSDDELVAVADKAIAKTVSGLPRAHRVLPLGRLEDYLEDYRERREEYGNDHATAVKYVMTNANFDVLMGYIYRPPDGVFVQEVGDLFQ